MMEKIVIVGAGQAAAQAIASLRGEGYTGAITLVGDEPYPPYQRPPLSKAYLLGKLERDRLFLKPDQFYTEAGVDLRLGVQATAIDRPARRLKLSDSSWLAYDKLLLATGTRVRRIRVPGADLAGVHYLRSISDVDLLRPALVPGKRLAVIGGGYIGLEVAAVAVKLGLEVTVFEALERLMARAVSSVLSEFYLAEHRAAGVKFHLNTGVEGFAGDGHLRGVRAGGAEHAADLALVGIGVLPNIEIAAAAGLSCDDGIVVDRYCASIDDPEIFAAGDCTRHHGRDGALLRLECVQNAIDQAKHAALAMLGRPAPYSEVPWFWSDQYDLKMQIAGLARPGDDLVLRGDPAARKFAVFHLRRGVVAAVEAVNAPPEYIVGRKLITDASPVSAERLADTAISMKQIV
jgi:3-phenylpropionate/trans-cinnamate dioxygenase ferredoxin reductase subunit